MRIPFFFRLTASIIVIQMIMLSVLVWNNVRLFNQSYSELLRATAEDQSALLSAAVAPGLIAYDIAIIEDALSVLKGQVGLSYAEIYDVNAQKVASIGSSPEFEELPKNSLVKVAESAGLLHVARQVYVGSQRFGSIRVGFNKAFMNQKIDEIRWYNQVISLAALLVLVIVTIGIGIVLTRKLKIIQRGVNKFREGNLDYKINVTKNDELGDLADAFNQMASELGESQKQLIVHHDELEDIVAERTGELKNSNDSLKQAFRDLNQVQNQLIESEKMAALGGLVSGVAHEINTPIGVSLTAASCLTGDVRTLKKEIDNGQMKRSSFNHFLKQVEEGTVIIESNLLRASELIRNFKQVAVDQSIEEVRKINLGEYLGEVLTSLKPKWKHTAVELETDLADDVEMTTYPGAVAQIITNLIENSLNHGFEEGRLPGKITIHLTTDLDRVVLKYCDTGKGMNEEVLARLFDPFFTTRRGEGGTGLGMHIVYNIVTQKLGGMISCISKPGEGCRFKIQLPEQI